MICNVLSIILVFLSVFICVSLSPNIIEIKKFLTSFLICFVLIVPVFVIKNSVICKQDPLISSFSIGVEITIVGFVLFTIMKFILMFFNYKV